VKSCLLVPGLILTAPFYLCPNTFFGAPALQDDECESHKQKTIAGASLQMFDPTGQYDTSDIVNLDSRGKEV